MRKNALKKKLSDKLDCLESTVAVSSEPADRLSMPAGGNVVVSSSVYGHNDNIAVDNDAKVVEEKREVIMAEAVYVEKMQQQAERLRAQLSESERLSAALQVSVVNCP
jgi:hypothetical protein